MRTEFWQAMNSHVYHRTFHNSQYMKITQSPSMDEWIERCGTYTQEALFSYEKERYPSICKDEHGWTLSTLHKEG